MTATELKIVPDAIVKLWLMFAPEMGAFEGMISAIIVNMGIPYNSDVSTKEIHDCIEAHCKETGEIPCARDWTLGNGCLYMDGEFVKRVGSKEARPTNEAFWKILETRIGYCRTE